MSNIPDVLIPLFFRFNAKRWSDTVVIIIPPHTSFLVTEHTEEGRAILNYFIKLSKPRIYDPVTGELGDVIISDEVGLYRMSEHVKWHNVPMVESTYEEGYGDITITGGHQYECTVYMYNNTDHYVYFDVTCYLIEFDISDLEDVKKYFKGIADFFIRQAEGGDRLWALTSEQST